MSIYLKVKIKSLAEEARIIRKEEQKVLNHARSASVAEFKAAHYQSYDRLWRHRTYDVRTEARATLLAYAYLRGVPYAKVEATRNPEKAAGYAETLVWKRATDMVRKYGSVEQHGLFLSGKWETARSSVEAAVPS